jgi:pyruvate kinase
MQEKIEWLGVSFVQSSDDIKHVRSYLKSEAPPLLISKIERARALSNLEEIVRASDAVMVARGDLGVETELARVPLLQKRIIMLSNKLSKPVITATQMLESMIEHPQPTRAEVTDVANAIIDGTDAVMLSGETAIGKYPTDATNMLKEVISATEREYSLQISERFLNLEQRQEEGSPIAFAACQLAKRVNAKAIVIPAKGISDVSQLVRFRPDALVLALVSDESLEKQLSLVWAAVPLFEKAVNEYNCGLPRAISWLKRNDLARSSDSLVVFSCADSQKPFSNSIRIVRIP